MIYIKTDDKLVNMVFGVMVLRFQLGCELPSAITKKVAPHYSSVDKAVDAMTRPGWLFEFRDHGVYLDVDKSTVCGGTAIAPHEQEVSTPLDAVNLLRLLASDAGMTPRQFNVNKGLIGKALRKRNLHKEPPF